MDVPTKSKAFLLPQRLIILIPLSLCWINRLQVIYYPVAIDMAMENLPFTDECPSYVKPIYKGFLDFQMSEYRRVLEKFD